MAVETAPEADIDDALAHHAQGRLVEAEAIYRAVLHATPDDPDALNLLGLLLHDRGDVGQSIEYLSRALEVDPDFPEALTNLARAQLTSGQVAVALTAATRAVALDADLPEAHLQLGRVLIEQGEFHAAETALRRCLALSPGLADGHLMLGIAHARQNQAEQAIEQFEIAHAIRPGAPAMLAAIGSALVSVNRLDEALAYQQRAAAIVPRDPVTHTALAVTYRRKLDPVSSAQACRTALELDPNQADVWLLLGANLASLGDFREAEACQRRALTLRPGSAEASRDLALIGRHGATDSEAARLRSILDDPQAPETERIAAGFGLGNLSDQAGDFDHAFHAFAAANRQVKARLAREGQAFNLEDLRRTVDWLIATFDRAFFEKQTVAGNPSDRPVFIVGMPRSGTSLVEQIVASHPGVFGAGERKDIGQIVRHLDGGPANIPVTRWNPEAKVAAADAYIGEMSARSGDAKRFTDKMPDNILFLGHIAALFPNAQVIYCRRDPRDVCLSAFFQQFGDTVRWSYDLFDCANRAREIERLGAHWLTVLPGSITEVRYEDLVANLEGESRRLIAFLGLPWDPACVEFHRTDRAVLSSSYWQVRQPLYSRSVGKWRRYSQHLQPLVLSLMDMVSTPTAGDWAALVAEPQEAMRAALLHHDEDRIDTAETILRAVLLRHPRHADAHYQLGLITARAGQIDEAITCMTASIEADPAAIPVRVDLARALTVAGKTQEAAVVARRATELDPLSGDAWIQVGNAAAAAGKWADATVAYREGVRLDPSSSTFAVKLARSLFESREFPEARDAYQTIVDAEPDNIEALVGLSAALVQLPLYDEALAVADRAIAADPQDPRLHFQLAWVFYRAQLPKRAVEICDAGLRLQPRTADLWVMRADMYGNIGDFDAAAESYRRVLTFDPLSGPAIEGLVRLGRHTDVDAFVATVADRAADAAVPWVERASAAFALAGIKDKEKDYDAAFGAYALANRLTRDARSSPNADIMLDRLRGLVDWSKNTFKEETFLDMLPFGSFSNLPVFIVGMPRSGTTLIEQIIASHPSAIGLGERTDIVDMPGLLSDNKTFKPPAQWDAREIHRQTAGLIGKLRSYDPNALRIVNKMPDNIQSLGQIAVLFPRAHIIISRRDLRDVCWSCFTQNFFDEGMIWADTLEECAMRARLIEDLTDHWLKVLPIPVLEMRYESLVSDLEVESKRLIDFLGLPWDPACLSFHKNERQVMTASVWQVRQPLYSSSVGRWKRYREHLTPLLDGLKGLVSEDD